VIRAYSVFAALVLTTLFWIHFTGWSPSHVTEDKGVPNVLHMEVVVVRRVMLRFEHRERLATRAEQTRPATRRVLLELRLATPYDGSMAADRAISGFTSRWIDHLIGSVSPNPQPAIRSGYVSMQAQAWHEVSVLKFVNQYFILDRPDLAMFQRGQEETV